MRSEIDASNHRRDRHLKYTDNSLYENVAVGPNLDYQVSSIDRVLR